MEIRGLDNTIENIHKLVPSLTIWDAEHLVKRLQDIIEETALENYICPKCFTVLMEVQDRHNSNLKYYKCPNNKCDYMEGE